MVIKCGTCGSEMHGVCPKCSVKTLACIVAGVEAVAGWCSRHPGATFDDFVGCPACAKERSKKDGR